MPATRRQILVVAGEGLAAAFIAGRSEIAAAAKCALLPGSTEGPFYVDPRLERSDIGESRPGTPLLLKLKILDAQGCAAARGARVDVWHCDADGDYSSFEGRGGQGRGSRTYLRGHQRTDASGLATFRTIWPGWYQGRVPHVHFKVFLDDAEALTAQLYFPDELNARVYDNAAYRRRWTEAARNANDGIFRGAGGAGVASVTQESGGLTALLEVGVARKGVKNG